MESVLVNRYYFSGNMYTIRWIWNVVRM